MCQLCFILPPSSSNSAVVFCWNHRIKVQEDEDEGGAASSFLEAVYADEVNTPISPSLNLFFLIIIIIVVL